MRGVDLAKWTFDWDLTFALLTVHPDGTVLHRYGGRDAREPDHWLTEASFQRFLEASLSSHAAHEPQQGSQYESQQGNQAKPKEAPPEPLTIDSIPAFAERDKGACIHCHSALPALRLDAQFQGDWTRDKLWVYPPPAKIGVDLDRDEQSLITLVAPDSPAGRAGLRAGDRLTAIATATDLMALLHDLPPAAVTLQLDYQREGAAHTAALQLAAGWKIYTPREFAWRPSKWGLSPAPGFGGPVQDAAQLKALGLPESTFAFQVDYLVTWGENQARGKAAAAAGITKGTIILGTDTTRDFDSIDHFHAWWRLKVSKGSDVRIATWQDGDVKFITLPRAR